MSVVLESIAEKNPAYFNAYRGLRLQRDKEGGAASKFALDMDVALMQVHQLTRNRQSQAGSAILAADASVGLREFIEDG